MENQSQEACIHLAIQAIRQDRKLNRYTTAKFYNIPRTTLVNRINKYTPFKERRLAIHKLTKLKEEIIIRYILELDTKGIRAPVD